MGRVSCALGGDGAVIVRVGARVGVRVVFYVSARMFVGAGSKVCVGMGGGDGVMERRPAMPTMTSMRMNLYISKWRSDFLAAQTSARRSRYVSPSCAAHNRSSLTAAYP